MEEHMEQEKEIIVEDDVVKIETDEEIEVEESSEKEVSEETKVKTEETSTEQLDLPDGFLEKIKGKSTSEVAKMLYDSEKFRGNLTNELGELRAEKRDIPKTSKDIKAEMSKTDKKITEFQNKINKLDQDIDEDEIAELQVKQQKLHDRKAEYQESYTETFINEAVQNIAVGDSNKKIAEEQRSKYDKDYGLKFSDEDWEGITEYAKSVSKEPKLSQEDYEYSLMKAYGIDKYRKILSAQSEAKARNDIEEATKKQVVNVGATSKKSYITIDFSGSEQDMNKQLDKLTVPQLKKLREKLNKG